jgi:hypothetical protein
MLITQLPTKHHELSWYILEDVLDCPVGSQFLMCISADTGDFERGAYYSKMAHLIASEIKLAGIEAEWWKMLGRKFIVLQGIIKRSSHFSDIKMKSVSRCQFVDAFVNRGGDIAMEFNSISSRLTIPWHDIIHASSTVMLFGSQFDQGQSFTSLFCKMKAQHAHHILCQFGSEYVGDSRACSTLYIEYEQARLDMAV